MGVTEWITQHPPRITYKFVACLDGYRVAMKSNKRTEEVVELGCTKKVELRNPAAYEPFVYYAELISKRYCRLSDIHPKKYSLMLKLRDWRRMSRAAFVIPYEDSTETDSL